MVYIELKFCITTKLDTRHNQAEELKIGINISSKEIKIKLRLEIIYDIFLGDNACEFMTIKLTEGKLC